MQWDLTAFPPSYGQRIQGHRWGWSGDAARKSEGLSERHRSKHLAQFCESKVFMLPRFSWISLCTQKGRGKYVHKRNKHGDAILNGTDIYSKS